MANIVVAGIMNGVAVGGAVRATAKNATAHSGMPAYVGTREPFSYLLGVVLDESPTELLQ
jgi:hypothetical protein